MSLRCDCHVDPVETGPVYGEALEGADALWRAGEGTGHAYRAEVVSAH